MKAFRFAPKTVWIKSESGNTYLCPAGIKEGTSDEELQKHCVSESENPQNN